MSTKATEKYPVVTVSNNHLTTSSKNVADVFGKNHRDVLRAIDNLETPEEFNQRNFAPVEYRDAKGEKRPMVEITRDGFTILVMGFTGPKAMKFKLAYIDAFNKMEAELSSKPLAPAVLDTEILKTLIATSQQVLGLREQLAVLNRLEEYMCHFSETARSMNNAVEQLSKMSNVELAVRERIDSFAKHTKESSDRAYQRTTNIALDHAQQTHGIRRIISQIDSMMTLLAEEDSAKKGIIGFLETYLPQHEANDVQTTPNITPENDPARFIRECCAIDPFSSVELTFLYKVYKAWSLSNFAQALGPINFWEYLQENLPKGVTMEVRKSKRNLIGLKPVCDKNDRQLVRRPS